MQHTCPAAASKAPPRSRSPDGGYVTMATLILAAASAIFLVAMSGCHSAAANNAFAATPADKTVEARLQPSDTMPPLQPFDEHFVEVNDTDAN
jgi:hypothetical protein